MGSSSHLVSKLDFLPGLDFQEEVWRRFRAPVHHPLPSASGSFFLLVTFRRFLFRLTEESVALALQSCIGGKADGFHVKFLSTNHFRISISCKVVGFHIYSLRRVITSSFDLYFHLWNNGTPHWEREKRAWEIEQEKEWSTVLSKRAKRQAKAQAKKSTPKKVSFAKPLVQYPRQIIQFGAFRTVVTENQVQTQFSFGSYTHGARSILPCSSPPGNSSMLRSAFSEGNSNALNNSNPWATTAPSSPPLYCSRCLATGHTRIACKSQIRCKSCYNYGHVMKTCLTRTQPGLLWVPKRTRAISAEARTSVSLDSRARIPDTSASISCEQLHQNLISHLQPPHTSAYSRAAQTRCLDRLVVDRRALPDGFQLQGPVNLLHQAARLPIPEPIVVARQLFEEAVIPEQGEAIQRSGLEIVPWQPVGSVVALHILADFIEFRQRARTAQNHSTQSRVIVLPGPSSSDPEFEFESSSSQPSSPRPLAASPPRPRGSTSNVIRRSTGSRSSTPLVETSVRRSPRIRGEKDGFMHVHLGKRQRREVPTLSIPTPDGNPSPIPTSMLRSWGIDCGVAPGELSDEVLLQTPSLPIPDPTNDDQAL